MSVSRGYLEDKNTCPETKCTSFSYCLCLRKYPEKMSNSLLGTETTASATASLINVLWHTCNSLYSDQRNQIFINFLYKLFPSLPSHDNLKKGKAQVLDGHLGEEVIAQVSCGHPGFEVIKRGVPCLDKALQQKEQEQGQRLATLVNGSLLITQHLVHLASSQLSEKKLPACDQLVYGVLYFQEGGQRQWLTSW